MQTPSLEIKLEVVCSHPGSERDRTRMTGLEKDKEALKHHEAEKEKGEYNPPGGRRGVDRTGKINVKVSVSIEGCVQNAYGTPATQGVVPGRAAAAGGSF